LRCGGLGIVDIPIWNRGILLVPTDNQVSWRGCHSNDNINARDPKEIGPRGPGEGGRRERRGKNREERSHDTNRDEASSHEASLVTTQEVSVETVRTER